MSLLAPLFLIGLGMIALPIWLHRLQTQTPEREPFSSAMLLEASEQRVHLQKKLRYLLLLALRILLLIFLAVAFAKPVLERSAEVFAGDGVTLHFIVIDTSFSMSYGDRFDEAISIANTIIDEMESGQQAQIITADNHIKLVTDTNNDQSKLRSALNTVKIGKARLDFGALMGSLNGLLSDYNHNIAIHLISDFQTSGLPARFADLIPKTKNNRTVELALHPVSNSATSNWSVEFIRPDTNGINVGVRGFHDKEQQRTLTLKINGEDKEQLTRLVPASSGQAIYKFQNLELESGDNRIEIIMSPADELPGDDRRFAVIENSPPAPVLLLTTDPASLAVTYLTTALEIGNYMVETVNLADLDPRILQRYPWLVIVDLGAVNANLSAVLTDYLNAGGAIFAALGERTHGLDLLPITNHPLKAESLLGKSQFRAVTRIDTSHPVLANSHGWRSVNISRIIAPQTDADDKVLISLEGGQPLLLERQFGPGRLFLLTTNLDNTWSDLPIHSVFVSFIAETARYLAGEDILERQHYTGDSILLKQTGSASGQVIDPQGQTVLTLEDTHSSQNIELNQTGFYEVYTPGRQTLIAVNLDPRESDLRVISPDMMARWSETGGQRPREDNNVSVNIEPVRLELWHGLLLIIVLIVLAESILGNRYLSFRTGQQI